MAIHYITAYCGHTVKVVADHFPITRHIENCPDCIEDALHPQAARLRRWREEEFEKAGFPLHPAKKTG